MRALPALLTASITMAAAPSFAAPTRDACVAASEDAQTLKLKGQLRAAREKLLVCVNEACPKLVKKDCGVFLDEVDRAIPTIVFSVRSASGSDVTDVRVSLDAIVLFEHLDGRAVPVDVGPHKVRFEVPGMPPREESVVAREGEKNRIFTLTLEAPAPATVAPATTEPKEAPLTTTSEVRAAPPAVTSTPRRGPSIATWIVGGAGLATLAAAGIVGAISLNDRSSLYNRCGAAGTCSQSEVDGVYALYNTAYAGLAIGSALVAAGVVLFIVTQPSKPANSSTRLFIGPTLGGVVLSGRL